MGNEEESRPRESALGAREWRGQGGVSSEALSELVSGKVVPGEPGRKVPGKPGLLPGTSLDVPSSPWHEEPCHGPGRRLLLSALWAAPLFLTLSFCTFWSHFAEFDHKVIKTLFYFDR